MPGLSQARLAQILGCQTAGHLLYDQPQRRAQQFLKDNRHWGNLAKVTADLAQTERRSPDDRDVTEQKVCRLQDGTKEHQLWASSSILSNAC